MGYQLKYDDNGPARDFSAVTPSDTVEYGRAARGLYVGGTGAVVLVDANGPATATFSAVPAGTTLWVWHRRVNATGTTATNLVALF